MHRNDWHAAKAGFHTQPRGSDTFVASGGRETQAQTCGTGRKFGCSMLLRAVKFLSGVAQDDRSCESRSTSDGMNCNLPEACCSLASVAASLRRMVARSLPSEPLHFNFGDLSVRIS